MLWEILKFVFKVELRTVRDRKIKYKRIRSIFAVNFLWFLFLSLSVAISESQDISLEGFILDFVLIILLLELFLIFLSVLTEFETLIINQMEIEFFSFLPISSRSYKFAKYLNFLFYILLFSLSFNLAPSMVLLFFSSLVYGISWGRSALIFISYLITSSLFAITISNLVILFIFLTRLGRGNLSRFILPAQILVVFLTFFAYQVLNRYLLSSSSTTNLFDKFTNDLLFAYTPPVIFSKIFAFLLGISDSSKTFESLITLFVSLFLIFLSISFMNLENLQDMAEQERCKRRKTRNVFLELLKSLKRIIFKNEIEIAFYELIYAHLKRDRSIRIKLLTAFTISVAVAIYLLTFNEVENPIMKPTSRGNLLMLLTFLFAASVGSTAFISHRDFKASWVYNFIKRDWIKTSISALRKVLWYHILFPLVVIFFFVYLALIAEIKIIFVHFLVTVLFMKIFLNTAMLVSNTLPFSKPIDKVSSSEKIYVNLLILPMTIFVVMVEKWVYGFFRGDLYPKILLFVGFLFIIERILNKKIVDNFRWKAVEEL